MNKISSSEAYYKEVADYFDQDAIDFEKRYLVNPVLKRIRESFRNVTERYSFTNALEIGCGPGFDIVYFASKYPDRNIYGVDVSNGMVNLARENVAEGEFKNVHLATGSVENVSSLFPNQKFDLVYVYFGGLNTVYDLKNAAGHIRSFCSDDATLILTVVNRYYITEIPLWIIGGRFDKAFERILNKWRGYSDERKIPSRPYSKSDILNAFSENFDVKYSRGYSILYPAWYRSHLLKKIGKMADWFWKADQIISKTPIGNTGEYSLYAMKVK
jgi:SAM-dependent methyltransferase